MNREEFAEWINHPGTIEIFKEFKKVKEGLMEDLEHAGTINNESIDSTVIMTARVVGQIQGINQLLDIEFADDSEEEED